jgi:hypothetical protein
LLGQDGRRQFAHAIRILADRQVGVEPIGHELPGRVREFLGFRPDVEALLAGLRVNHGLSVPEIGRQAGISRIQAYRLIRGDVRRPSFETVTRLQRLEQKLVTKAVRPVTR